MRWTRLWFYLSPVLSLPLLLQMLWTSMFDDKKAQFSATGLKAVSELKSLLNELKKLLESGQLKSIPDRCYSLEEVAEAHRYIDTIHKKGNFIAIT
ncbi:zinc-binding dehydrogenase [Pricia sp. S334]|uniref:Zinc-binding dehydrogenase n=1 Tax=Pricia mediterranea TaxID=3076079 RepID=A0ABU3L750_9FLAO|nr:zinc-binding dehydrogenase [Pricia sp. S334]MDT7829580.1 zinc-binding dehydrogenase [Pricia sp. S334]